MYSEKSLAALAGIRVLIADPQSKNSTVLSELLLRKRIRPQVAETANEAVWALSASGPFDLIIVDEILWESGGPLLHNALERNASLVPALFVSGPLGQHNRAERFLNAGLTGWLAKPVRTRQATDAVLAARQSRLASDSPRRFASVS